MDHLKLLKNVPLLSELPAAELERLASSLEVVELEPGSVLFRENEPGDSLYIVIQGGLTVILGAGMPDEKVVASLGPGEFVGEMSLVLPGGLRTAEVRADHPTRLWRMTRLDFDELLLRQPRMAYAMVRTLSKRLENSNVEGFRDLQEKNRQLQRAYDELKSAQQQLIEKERLERELQVAAEIQTSILPQELPEVLGYDFGACMVPARMVGGDFYDVFPIDEDRIGFLIGDVADKGVPSAIFMARAHALIMAEASHSLSPGTVLKRANHHLILLAQSDLFVTVTFGILNWRSGMFEYARAGHEVPLLLSAEGQVTSLPHRTGQALGMLDEISLDRHKIAIPPGGTLLFFTDGVTDSTNPKGEQFGHMRLKRTLAALAGRRAQATCDRLWKSLQRFQSHAAQFDDVTLLALHSNRS
jgi:sigma-B regulation protein RsbU (phosphoserine phosphatase)